MFKKLNSGFTLIELLITMGIAVVLGGVAMSNYFNYQSSVTIDGAASELLGTLRDAQQRAISQDQEASWGVYINAAADGDDYYELFSGANYSSGTVISRTTLATDLKFIIPSQGSTKEVNYAKSTGLPNDNHTITISSVRDSSLFKTITINLSTGLIALETGLSSTPTIGSITPSSALNSASVNITDLSGTSFQSGASVKLTKSGQTDIVCTNVTFVSSQTLTCACDITGKASGSWNVVVTNPDARSGSLLNGFAITSTTVPDSPTLTYITPGTDSAVLNWTAPTNDGGSSITNYRIYRGTSAGAESFLTEIGNVLTYSDSNLTTGTNYYYKISAKNINGESVLSNELSVYIGSLRIFVTSTTYNGNLGGLSGADAKCQARADALSLGGTWKAWLSDETTSASSRLAHSTAPYVNIRGGIVANDWTGLTSGSLLTAIQYNESGVAASGQAWTGSYANGTSYFSQDCTAWTSTTGTGGDAGLSGLVTSTSGSWSFLGTNSCSTVLPLYCVEQPTLSVPDAPTIGSATAGNAEATISFSPPSSDGGSPISGYTVTSNPGGLTGTGSASPITVTGLTNGTSYTFTVTATNAIGTSVPSSASNSVVPVSAPGVPTSLVASTGDMQISLSWVAPGDTGGGITNYEIYRSDTSGGQGSTPLAEVAGTELVYSDTSVTNGQTYYYKVSAKNSVGESAKSNEAYRMTWDRTTTSLPLLFGSAVVSSNDKMLITGGYVYATGRTNKVWSSTDGVTWTETTAQWPARNTHAALFFNNKFWVLGGGADSYPDFNDVWYSTDGVSWTQATASAPWSVRNYFGAVVYDGKMWVIGGGSGRYNDVWYSTDGANWTQATASAAWSGRSNHKVIVYNGKMWLFGGFDAVGTKSDVWYSTDGANWTQAAASTAWGQKRDLYGAVFNDKMIVAGGTYGGGDFNNYIWSSTDGVTWTAELSAAWNSRYDMETATIFNNKLWFVGGKYNSDVWNVAISVQPSYFACGDLLTDVRDAQQYPTLTIANRCWMTKNLNIGTMVSQGGNQIDNGIIEKYCYNNVANDCLIYGGLYQIAEAAQYAESEAVQGICPTGWHIPTDTEWCIMEQSLDSSITCDSTGWKGVDVGGKLKETGTSHWASPNTGATNSSGFTALPGGYRADSGLSGGKTQDALFLTSSLSGSLPWVHWINYNYATINRSAASRTNGRSLRCIKDIGPKRVFVTSTTYNGNLGGLSGADAKCQARADAAALGGTWKAWLSSSTVDAASRITQTPSAYLRIDGSTIASSWSDLIDGYITNAISITELGTAVPDYGIWTNTTISGTRFSTGADQLCMDWTTGTEWNALIGLANNISNSWTNYQGRACTNLYHIYCFEQ